LLFLIGSVWKCQWLPDGGRAFGAARQLSSARELPTAKATRNTAIAEIDPAFAIGSPFTNGPNTEIFCIKVGLNAAQNRRACGREPRG
jgi:hypothetical protein